MLIMINNKILYRWVSICKYSNSNWGFRQHVIVCLLEVIMGTCVCYAGIIWFNRRSLSEVAGTEHGINAEISNRSNIQYSTIYSRRTAGGPWSHLWQFRTGSILLNTS